MNTKQLIIINLQAIILDNSCIVCTTVKVEFEILSWRTVTWKARVRGVDKAGNGALRLDSLSKWI